MLRMRVYTPEQPDKIMSYAWRQILVPWKTLERQTPEKQTHERQTPEKQTPEIMKFFSEWNMIKFINFKRKNPQIT